MKTKVLQVNIYTKVKKINVRKGKDPKKFQFRTISVKYHVNSWVL